MKTAFLYTTLFLYYLLATSSSFGQLLPARSGNTYIYRITAAEAHYLQEHPLTLKDTALFHDLVAVSDSFEDSLRQPTGHYLSVAASGNQLEYRYTAIVPWHIYLLENKDALLVQVIDQESGQPITDASLRVGNLNLTFDKNTTTYRLKGFHKEGFLSVVHATDTFWHEIEKEKNYTARKDRPRSKLLHLPVKYIIRPVTFLAKIPVDGIISWKKKHASGTIREIKQKIKTFRKRKDKSPEPWQIAEKYSDYFFFSKPKYRQGDTIRFKAQVLDKKKNQWLNKPLLVRLNDGYDDYYYLGKTAPLHKAAGYNFEFVIHDSMDIDLDKTYVIELADKDSIMRARGEFVYENYELKKSVFNMELPDENKEQRRGTPFEVHFTAKDENGFPMPDARLELEIKTRQLSFVQPDTLFVPDILWRYETVITEGMKTIQVPDSIFPQADISYTLNAVMRNSEQERMEESVYIKFRNNDDGLHISLEVDSIVVMSKTGQQNEKARLYAKDRFDITLMDTLVYLPFKIALNPHIAEYDCATDAGKESLYMIREPDNLQVTTQRERDSVFVTLINPGNLPVLYHFYEGNKEILRGIMQSGGLKVPVSSTGSYFLALNYIWAGRARAIWRSFPFMKDKVTLTVEQPPVVYPGKETDIRITATDYKNRPLAGMNILAYAFTGKFTDYTEPWLPYIGKGIKPLKDFDYFSIPTYKEETKTRLNYSYWSGTMQLDTSQAYRFLYPKANSPERFFIPARDSITQIAPFVVMDGALQPVQYVMIDNIPVYYGFTDLKMPYSFALDSASHHIKIRTTDKLITLDNFRARPHVKTLFSIHPSMTGKDIRVENYPDTFTIAERANLSPLIMNLNSEENADEYAYLSGINQQGTMIPIPKYESYGRLQRTIGPMTWKYWEFMSVNRFNVYFEYEPFYTYSFKEGRVKMKSATMEQLMPLHTAPVIPSLTDEVITKAKMDSLYREHINRKRMTRLPAMLTNSHKGPAQLEIAFPEKESDDALLNIILFRRDDFNFMAIYPGNKREFSSLEKGSYTIVLVQQHGIYRRSGIITVKNEGINFHRIKTADTLKGKDAQQMDSLLLHIYESNNSTHDKELLQIMNAYVKATYTGDIRLVRGTVYDENGEGMPAATVKLKGTNNGTTTDIDGRFEIAIPLSIRNPELEISSIGLESQTVRITTAYNVSVTLDKRNSGDLSEVSIYGQKVDRKTYTGAVNTITAKELSRQPIIDITNALEGQAPGVGLTVIKDENGALSSIQIQGNGPANTPLVIINGMLYSGGPASLDMRMIESISLVKDSLLTGLYGIRAAQGIIQITTRRGAQLPEYIRNGMQNTTPPVTEDLMKSGLRNNFRDDAYWQPDLRTDENGQVSFKVTFPDDITSWRSFVFATDEKHHTGQSINMIRSFKPLSASLPAPAFLVSGDSALALGKVMNYLQDSLTVTTTYSRNDTLVAEHTVRLDKFHIDSLLLTTGPDDSVKAKYILTQEDGYFDGEEKTLPILPRGTHVATGAFRVLDARDTTFSLPGLSGNDSVTIAATASLLDIVLDEVSLVRDYKYLCNEQLASKILTMLQQQRLFKQQHRPFSKKEQAYVQDMIDKLLQGRNSRQLWGWWQNSETVCWITNHVYKAMAEAKAMQYSVPKIDWETLLQPFHYQWESDPASGDLYALLLLHQSGIKADYEKYISRLENRKDNNMGMHMELLRLRQQLGLPYTTGKFLAAKQEDLFGNIYWKDTAATTAYRNEVLTTLKALEVLEADGKIPIPKKKVVNWLLQQRGSRGWRNTYESALVIEAIARYISPDDTAFLQPRLTIEGTQPQEITQFPYRQVLPASGISTIRKQGNTPVYFTWYQVRRDTARNDAGNFRLRSSFLEKGEPVPHLQPGEPVTLQVRVDVQKSAEYVMIEIPVPAGCSYADKQQPDYGNKELHREYFTDHVSIFCGRLDPGSHTFDIKLLPRYSGSYILNPAKAELMYFPVFYGQEQIKKITIN